MEPKLPPAASPWRWRTLWLLAFASVACVSFLMGRQTAPRESVQANRTTNPDRTEESSLDNPKNLGPNDRVVAYLHKNTPVTREEFGNFFIDRFGAERLEFFLKRKVLEMECKAKGIDVTDAEIDLQLKQDLAALGPNVTERDFQTHILKKNNKTLFEWKEDVVRSKLLLAKLARPTIQVTDEEVKKAFDAQYGERVQCRIIILQANDTAKLRKWERAKESEDGFKECARSQFLPPLAASGGQMPNAIHRNYPYPKLESEAFSLKEGEVSSVLDMPDGTSVILKCDKKLPRDTTKKIEQERETLAKTIAETKLVQRIPELFEELWRRAEAQMLIRPNDPRPAAGMTNLPAIPAPTTVSSNE